MVFFAPDGWRVLLWCLAHLHVSC